MNKNALKVLLALLFVLAACVLGVIAKFQIEKRRFPLPYSNIVKTYSEEFGLDPYLVSSIIIVESGGRPDAVSTAGAQGLMQLMPDTADWIAGKLKIDDYDVMDPNTNIRMGCWYLDFLFERFENTDSVFAAYNAGHNRVKEWLDDPEKSNDGKALTFIPYPETRDYVAKVQRTYEKIKKLYPKAYEAETEG